MFHTSPLSFAGSLFIYMNVSMFVIQCCRRNTMVKWKAGKYQAKIRKKKERTNLRCKPMGLTETHCILPCTQKYCDFMCQRQKHFQSFKNVSVPLKENIDAWTQNHNETMSGT